MENIDKFLILAPGVLLAIASRALFPHIFFQILFRLPGTLAHELCHFVCALLSNAQPANLTIIPHKATDGNWTLGSVSCNNIRWYNGFLVGLAPLLLFGVLYISMPKKLELSASLAAYWLLTAALLPSAFPSRTDLKVTAISLVPVFIVALLALLFFWHFA